MKKTQPKYFVLCSALMLAVSAYIFSVSIGLPYIFMACSALLLVSIFLPFRVRYNDRSVIYSIVFSLVFAVIFDLFFPMDRDKFMLVGEILQMNISAPFLIYFCAFMTFFEFKVHTPGLVSAISIALLLMTADIQKGGDTASKLPFFSYAGRTQDKLFVVAMAIQIVLLIAVISYGKPVFSRKFGNGAFLSKTATIILALGLCAALTVASIRFHGVFESQIRKLEGALFRYSVRGIRRGASYMSSRNIDLRKPMRGRNDEAQRQIILRATSKDAPGYLRGRAYDHYVAGVWLPAQLETRRMNSRSYEGILVYRTFFFGKQALYYPLKTEFLYSGDFKTNVLLVPGNYEQIDLVAEQLTWNENGMLTPEDWDKDGGYTVFTEKSDKDAAFNVGDFASRSDHSVHLAVPESLIPALDGLLMEIFPDKAMNRELSDADKAAEIRNYFASQYRYSLDFAMDLWDRDPIETFFKLKKGHCELFASSSVLLARRLGIPARYVTGFLCFEKHPIGAYYVSRLENAHAWAEIYLRDEGRWVLLEATPEDGIPRFSQSGEWGFFRSYADYFYKTMQSALADVRRGFFAKAVITVIVSIYEALKDVLWHPLRGALLPLAILLFFLFRRMVSRRRRRSRWKISDETLMLADEFSAFEKRLAARTGFAREASETAREWTARVSGKFPAAAGHLSEFLARYQNLRFYPATPSREQIADIRRIRKNFPWKSVRK